MYVITVFIDDVLQIKNSIEDDDDDDDDINQLQMIKSYKQRYEALN